MYKSYFGLTEAPFSIAPDPRYLYMSQRHQEALAHLLFGVNGEGGFVLLTGEVGAGKTTICRCLLEQIPESCVVAYIFNPRLTVEELLSSICVEYGIAYPPGNTSIKLFIDFINAYLLESHAKGKRAVLIIDEAQNLSTAVLEQMRLLTNLETSQRKLLQIILLGQPELAAVLAKPELRQLSQRVVARYHLGPLTKQEVGAYLRHRLEVSGAQRQLFPPSLTNRIHRLSGGVPRLINVLCDRALLGAYVQGKDRVDKATLAQSAREVIQPPAASRRGMFLALSFGFLLVAGLTAWYIAPQKNLNTAVVNDFMDKVAGPSIAAQVPVSRVAPPIASQVAEMPALPEASGQVKERAVTASPATARLDALDWPVGEDRARSKDMAYSALFLAWGTRYQGKDACRQAEGLGLRCYIGRGGLNELRQFNRPAILNLRDDAGQEFHAALTALDADGATFAVGPETVRVTLGALAMQWSGHYTTLVRMPPEEFRKIRPGERGASVQWLAKLLSQATGKDMGASPSSVLDAALIRQIRQFQLAEGLVPDGAIGPQTLARLINAADQNAPRLSGRRGEG